MIITFNGNSTILIKRQYKQLSAKVNFGFKNKEGQPFLFFLNWQLQITLISHMTQETH